MNESNCFFLFFCVVWIRRRLLLLLFFTHTILHGHVVVVVGVGFYLLVLYDFSVSVLGPFLIQLSYVIFFLRLAAKLFFLFLLLPFVTLCIQTHDSPFIEHFLSLF